MEAQRECLNWAAEAIVDLPGCVLELGLGNGRTFDHLREIFPNRDIFVFDRQVAAHPDCIPSAEFLFLGDFSATLPAAVRRLGPGSAVLAHVDLGSGDAEASRQMARSIAPILRQLLCQGGILVSDQDMQNASLLPQPLPPCIKPGRYFMVRAC